MPTAGYRGERYSPPETIWEPKLPAASNAGAQAIANFEVPEGVTISLFAAEPMVANPVAFDVDARGRVFVAETFRQETEGVPDNRTFPEWLQDDLRLQTVEERGAMYLAHHPEFGTEWTDSDDRIRMLEDTDGDGVADRSVVFAHGFRDLLDGTGAGVLARGDDVYYTCIPKLWKLTDADGDGVADDGEALHHGYGVRVAFRGHDMHGLVLGPDRRLYFSVGDRGYHVINREGAVLSDPGRGAVFRCELDGSDLEVYARGLRNPQELAFDDFGNLYTVDNNCDAGDRARLVYVMEQGDSGWSMNFQYLPDRGPWMSEDWWKPAGEGPDQPAFLNSPVANITAGPSGFAHYPGVGLPAEYDNSFFIVDFRGGAGYSGITNFTVEPSGAGFQLGMEKPFWWKILATDFAFGPDGSMWASDWVAGWVGEGKGRIYRAEHEGADHALMTATAALLGGDFTGLSVEELVALLAHADRRVRFEAQWALVDLGAGAELAGVATGEMPVTGVKPMRARLHAIWGLQMLGDAPTLATLLAAAEAEIASAAASALGECAPDSSQQALIALLRDSADASVRYHAAMALGKGGAPQAFPSLVSAARDAEGMDRFLRHALSWSMAQCADATALAALSRDSSAGARMAAVIALRLQKSARLSIFLADEDAQIAAEAARAIYDKRVMAAFPALASYAAMPSGFQAAEHRRPFLRRTLAAANYLGREQDAAALMQRWESLADEKLKKEVQRYLEHWPVPREFDPVLNESWSFAADRSVDYFVGIDLPFETQDDRDAAARGREIFTGHPTSACTQCHSLRGVTPAGQPNDAGPDLTGVGLRLDEAALHRSIIDPYAEIAAGFEVREADGTVLPVSAMLPNFGKVLSEEEQADLVAFLTAQRRPERILIHVESKGYEHAVAKAGDDGLSLVEKQWQAWADADPRFDAVIDRSANWCNTDALSEIDAVFFYTTGELDLSVDQRTTLLEWIRTGGAFTGSHCATDTFYDWPEYGAMLGAYFINHPWHEEVGVVVEDPHHLATRHLSERFRITDEIYQFKEPYERDRVSVLLSLDTLTTAMDKPNIEREDLDFAISWTRVEGLGRVFYTSLGHRAEVWKSELFRDHLVNGVLWAAR